MNNLELTIDLGLETLLSDAALDAARAAGIVSVSAPFGFFDLEDSVLSERARALRSRGMRVDTCHLPYGGGNSANSACSEIDAIRNATIAMWQRYLRKFSLVGVKATPLHTGGCMHPALPEWLRDRLTDTLEQILPFARDCGTIIALENTFFSNPPPFQGMENLRPEPTQYLNDNCPLLADYVRKWNDPQVGVCFDIGHSNILGHNVLQDYATLQPLVALFHLHDNDGDRDQHYAPGMGTVPWEAFMKALDAGSAPLYIEVLRDPDPERHARIFSLENSVETMRRAKQTLGV